MSLFVCTPGRGTVAAACLLLNLPMPGLAQALSQPLESVTVAAKRPLALAEVGADVTVIDAERLRQAPQTGLAELLQAEAGIAFSRYGGAGQATSLHLRGASASQVLVLVDGVRQGSSTLGQVDLATLGLAAIERIEILRGPAASLHGADAMGGVVSITTRRGSTGAPAWHAALDAGGLGSRNLSGGVVGVVDTGLGRLDHAFTVSHEASRGVSAVRAGDSWGNANPDADGFRRGSLQAAVGLSPAAGHRVGLSLLQTRLNARYDAAEYLPPDFAPDASHDMHNHQRSHQWALDYQGRLANDLELQLRGSRLGEDVDTGGVQRSIYHTRRDQWALQLNGRFNADHGWTLAHERQDDQARSTDLAAPVARAQRAWVAAYQGRLDTGAGPLHLQADARRDQGLAADAVHTGRLALRWQPPALAGVALRAVAGRSFRAPSFNELHYPGWGVASLNPERGRSLEFGLVHEAGAWRHGLTLWRQRLHDLIANSSDPAACPAGHTWGCAVNIGRATLQGASAEGAWQGQGRSLRARYEHLEARDDATGQALPRRARHLLAVHAQAQAWGLDWQASWQWRSARQEAGRSLRGRGSADAAVGGPLAGGWRWQARLENLGNADIEPALDYHGMPRRLWLGLRFGG